MDLKKPAILSISLLNVITNAAVAPILGLISLSFPDMGKTFIKQVVTIPSLMIIIFSIISGQMVRKIPKKLVLVFGLALYLLGAFFSMMSQNFQALIIFRALMGAGAGLIIPLGSSLITDFYEGKERAEMMGYSTFTSYIGAAIAPLLIGRLASSKWQDAFFIYSIAIVVLILTMLFIPNKTKQKQEPEKTTKLKINFSVVLLALLGCGIYMIFYLMPTDISFLIENLEGANPSIAASLLAIEIIAAASAGIIFSHQTRKLGSYTFPLGFALMAAGFFAVYQSASFLALFGSMIIIGLGIGTLRPLIYYRTTQMNTADTMTTAFALVNSGFSLGQFLSPFFYYIFASILTTNSKTGNYLLAGIILFLAFILAILYAFRTKTKSV